MATAPRPVSRTARSSPAAGRLLLLLACAATALPAIPARGDPGHLVRRGGHRVIATTAMDARAGLELPDVFIVTGSDTLLWGAAALSRGADYSIDYRARTITVSAALPDTSRLELRYDYLPYGLAPEYGTRPAAAADSLPSGFPATVTAAPSAAPVGRPAEEPAASLRVGGSKTFGITVGSERDMSLEQSLRMSVSGNITRDVAVNAYLSDQNTPLVPEGDTEELRSLDDVLVEIEGEHVGATMGDYQLVIDGGTLATVRRDLSGIEATGELGQGSLLLAGARLNGEFTSLTLRGQDGKQGPYLLTDRSGVEGVVVVAGSERVWLDGGLLVRGRDRDYVIDYAAGSIEFTERRPVTSDSEITADYEYALGDYARDIYGGRAVLALADGTARVGASFVREADDRGAEIGASLSDDDVAALEAAGDEAWLAESDGIEFVGPGEGDYVMLAEGVFEFAGADSGDYDLFFEPSDGGDYGYDYEEGVYQYVGPGEGDYRLGRTLALPVDKGIVAMDARVDFADGGFVTGEAAVSSLDRNTFSGEDDDDNLGNAQTLAARLPALGMGPEGAADLSFGVNARRVGGNFDAPGRFREVRYEEEWELEGLAVPGEEAMAEATGSLALKGGGRVDLSYGLLDRGDALTSSKAEFALSARPTEGSRIWADGRFVDLDYAVQDSALTRSRSLYRGGAEQRLGPLVPSATYAHDERTTDDAGERYDEYGAKLAASRGSASLSASYTQRLTDRPVGGDWERASTTRTQEYAAHLPGNEKLTVDATVLSRDIDYEPGFDEPGTRYDLASIRLGHRSFAGAVSGELRYSVTATEIEEKERYVTYEDGVEITRTVSTGRYLPVTDLSVGTRWGLRLTSAGGRELPDPSALVRFLSGVSLETDVKLSEVSTTDDRLGLYLLSPDVIQGPETVRGEITSRSVARYSPPGGRVSVRLSFETLDELDRSYSNASDVGEERAGTADVKVSRGSGLTFRLQGDLESRDQRSEGSGSSYEIRQSSLLGEVTSAALTELELTLTGSTTGQREHLEEVDVTVLLLTPSATYRFRGKGAITASITWSDVGTDAETLPYYLADGRPPGLTTEWRVSGDYRLNRFLTGSVSYTGEARPEASARHTLDMRVNAYF